MTAPTTPHGQHEADIAAVLARMPRHPFRGIRIPYSTSRAGMKAVAAARTWYSEARRRLDPDGLDKPYDAPRYLRGVVEKIDAALASGDVTPMVAERLPTIRTEAQAALDGIAAADNRRDEAQRSAREVKDAAFPKNLDRRVRMARAGEIRGIVADIFDFFGVDSPVDNETPLARLRAGLGAAAQSAEGKSAMKVYESLRAASEATTTRAMWLALAEAEDALEAGR